MEKIQPRRFLERIPPPEAPSDEKLVAMYEEVVLDASLAYYDENLRAVVPLNQETLRTIGTILLKALKDSLPSNAPLPTSRHEIKKGIAEGLKRRKEVFLQGCQVLKEVKEMVDPRDLKSFLSSGDNLAIERELIRKANIELDNYHLLPDTFSLTTLIREVNERKKTVLHLACLVGKEVYPEFDLETFKNYFYTPTLQAQIVRARIAQEIIERGYPSIEVSPLFIKHDQLPLLVEAQRKVGDLDGLVTSITEGLGVSDEDKEKFFPLLWSFARQVVETAGSWLVRLDGQKDFGYYERLDRHFRGFPLTSVFRAVVPCMTANEIREAYQEGRPTLWDHSVLIGGRALPSVGDLSTTLLFLKRQRPDDERIPKLKSAIGLWEHYTRAKEKHPQTIARLRKRLKELPNLPFSSKKEHRVLKRPYSAAKVAALSKSLIRFQRLLDINATLRSLSTAEATGFRRKDPELWRKYLGVRRDVLSEKNKRNIGRREKILSELETPDITHFPFYARGAKFIRPEDVKEVEAERKMIEELLSEVEGDNLSLPRIYSENIDKLLDYLSWRTQIFYSRRREESDEVVRATRGKNVLLLRRGALTKSPKDDTDARYFRDWFVKVARRRSALLSELARLNEKLDIARQEISQLDQILESGSSILLSEGAVNLSQEEWRDIKRWIRMNVVSLEIEGLEGLDTHFAQVKNLLGYYVAGEVRQDFVITRPSQIRGVLEERAKVATGNYKTFLRTLIKARKNPLLPLKEGQGSTLEEFVEAIARRLKTIEAIRNYRNVLREHEEVKRKVEEARALKESLAGREREKEILRSIKKLQKEEKGAEGKLVKGMEALGLAADPRVLIWKVS